MVLAQQQLAARGIPFFVNYLIGDSEHAMCPSRQSAVCKRSQVKTLGSTCSGLDMLRTELGNSTVWCVDPRDHKAIWPKLYRDLTSFAATHRVSFPKPSAIAGIHWAWLLCDAHAIVGAYRNLHRMPDHLWVFDYDITWVGDLSMFITAFDSNPADLLVAKDDGQAIARCNARGDVTYAQWQIRNYLKDDEVWSSLLAPVRYSRRMVEAMRELIGEGKLAFCETRGPSLCRHSSNAGWCRGPVSMQKLRPDLFNRNFSCCKSFSERYSRERWAIWKSLPAATRPPCQLLHRVKVDEHAPGTAAAAGAEANRARQERHSVKSGSSDGGGPSTGVCKKQAG